MFDKVQEEMARRARVVHKEDGTVENPAEANTTVNIFWGICSYVVIAEHLIGEEQKGVRWFGDVLRGWRKERWHVPIHLH